MATTLSMYNIYLNKVLLSKSQMTFLEAIQFIEGIVRKFMLDTWKYSRVIWAPFNTASSAYFL